MDEPESLDSEMTELQECSYEPLESLSQDDEDEVEELQNSLREVIQDHSVKPKLQCLMVDPSFSMVTVQSEDSGIVWETASSRCSTPWASETSSVSEGGSMEGSGAAGNITIIFDEEKVVRRRTRSGRSSRLSDRFSRPGSSRSASALGVERLEMMEVSQPNVKQDKTKTEPDLEEIKSMDQQLFSLISEGYEILNIRVPSKLPTVDEEESTELQDNLSYLDQTPKIKSRNHHQWTPVEGEDLQAAESQNEESKDTSPHPPSDSDLKPAADGPGDIDYFEKFTLLDVVTPDEQAAEEQDECITPVPPPEPEQTTKDTVKTISPSASEESFVFVSDEDIVGEHLDEVFYGEGPPADLVQQSEEEAKERMRRQSSVKESGSVLFESEETVLTPIYISSGPPKIIDPILLEEPTAMSFMYSDLYEDAMGERRRSDEEYSEAESVTSEKSYKRCLTDDCEEADSGYLEKFILKDETPNVEVSAEVVDDHKGGRMMWSQNEFEMSGCLTRVVEAEDTEETMKGDEIKETRPFEKSSESSISQVEHENKVLTSYQKEESVEKSKVTEFETSSESSISQVEHENNVSAPDQKDKIIEKSKVIEGKHTEIKKPPGESQSVEVVSEVEISEIPKQESVEQSTSEIHLPTEKMEITDEAATIDTPAPATDILQTAIQGDETQVSESIVDAVVEDTGLEIPKDSCLEVIADCEPPVQAHVEVIEKGEIDIQTQVCIDLQEVNLATTSTVDDLDQEGEIMTQDDAKIEPVEKPIEIVKQEDVSSEELVASEVKADVVKEMVNDSGELILLVPKGQAVEMDIEISPQPDMSPADQEVDQADNLELIAEVVTQPESEIVSKFEEKAKEDLHLPKEEIKEADKNLELEKQEIVPSIPSNIFQKEMPFTVQEPIMESQKPEVEYKTKDIEASVDETPSSMDESHKVKQKTDLKEPIYTPPQEIPVTVPETITQIQTDTQLQEKVHIVIMTAIKDEDVTTVLAEECPEAEQIAQVVSEETEIVSDKVDLPPASEEGGQNVALEEQEMTSETVPTVEEEKEIISDKVDLPPASDEGRQNVALEEQEMTSETVPAIEEEPENAFDKVDLPTALEEGRQNVALEEQKMTSETVPTIEEEKEIISDKVDLPPASVEGRQNVAPEEQEITSETVPTHEEEKEIISDKVDLPPALEEGEQNIALEEQEMTSETVPTIEKEPENAFDKVDLPTALEEGRQNVALEEQKMTSETVPTIEEEKEIISDKVDLPPASVEGRQNVAPEEQEITSETVPTHEEEKEIISDKVDLPPASDEGRQNVALEEQEMTSETVPTIEEEKEIISDKVDLPPASDEGRQNVALEEQDIASVITETTRQDWSVSLSEAETEELDYEIVNKQEGEESHSIESGAPKQELDQYKEIVSEELEEEHTECKDNSVADEEQTLMGDVEEETGVHSTLKRFTPLQDLSGLHAADVNLETANIEENALDLDHQMDISEDVQDVCMQDVTEDAEKKVSPDVSMEYEIITEQDTTEMAQAEMEDERVELVKENEYMEDVLEDTADTEELMEVDYETIDVEEEHQARLAAELEGLDWYCLSCGCLLPEQESGPHQSHDVTAVDKAYEEIMEKLSEWISELQGRSENIEDLVSELELAYNSVEEQFHKSETEMQAQNEEMMALVMDQYNSMSVSMEEEKKAKLEQLYDQIVSFQESIDSAKGTLETTAREAETDARSPEDIHARLIVALDSAMSLELGPKGLLVFEDYAKGNTSSSQLAQRKGIAVPQRPTLQVQEPGSATSSSVTVYWKVNSEDVIDCFQVYCMEDPQGVLFFLLLLTAISEEYRVTVKESYCVLEELEPDKSYKVWVMAVNYTGCSLPSARLIFKTAPSVPVIDTDRCTVTWDTAFLRWSSMQKTPELSYTLEYCRQYELEGEGLRTISGIKNFEHKVLLQPNENYLVYIKAVSEAGSSEQSEAALISTKGTKFHLQKATAHPALELSMDQTTLHYSQDTYDNMPDKACPSILGEQLPVRGRYYWENDVSRCTDYRLGVAYSSANINSPLGESQLSWCLQCTPTPSGCSYHLVHNDIHSSLFVIDLPERVGIFLDYQFGCLSFYNAQSGQLLGSFSEHFTQPCHPAVGMDAPGSVEVCMVQEVPEFAKDS
ncbi:cardiomyopathy-associated protein 5 [Boleophthalmus pectinirostris]|uniref:cardiomyopathy-associated protein 5 n=1 Tax=Boleophthalmus pectinirostris TaxID=150288 RepID=UPI00242D6BBB|nr:cardiomyopathy-associated protein 5 [Boleophthalmus pectinirostris]